MFALLRFFFDLARLRRGPQELPSSVALLVLLACVNLLLGSANGSEWFGGVGPAMGANLLDLLLMMVMLLVLLQFKHHSERWLQTASAFFGIGVLAGSVMLVVRPVLEPLGLSGLVSFIDLLVLIWVHVALGHVLRHALSIPLPAGILIVFTYTLASLSLISRVFPPVIPAS